MNLLHWNYFLALESDVERLARFVEFTSNNYETYSIEIAHLYLAAASEVDVVAKLLCSKMDPSTKATNMDQYRLVLRPFLPELENLLVCIPRYSLDIRPWSSWRTDENPNWWKSYNKVKHQRGEYLALANLENLLNAVAGLFLLVMYYYRGATDDNIIEPPPMFFKSPEQLASVYMIMDGGMALVFK